MGENAWMRIEQRRLSRRKMLTWSARLGVGAAGLALVGCGDDDDDDRPQCPDAGVTAAQATDAELPATSGAGDPSELRDFAASLLLTATDLPDGTRPFQEAQWNTDTNKEASRGLHGFFPGFSFDGSGWLGSIRRGYQFFDRETGTPGDLLDQRVFIFETAVDAGNALAFFQAADLAEVAEQLELLFELETTANELEICAGDESYAFVVQDLAAWAGTVVFRREHVLAVIGLTGDPNRELLGELTGQLDNRISEVLR